MKLNRLVNYKMDFSGKWAELSAVLMGIGFFFQALFYLTVHNLTTCSPGEILICMILPLLAAAAWMLLLRVLPLRNPQIYGILAAVLALILGLWGFFTAGKFAAILGLLWYMIAAAVVVFVSFGYLPYRIAVFAVFIIPAALRIFIILGMYILPGNLAQGLSEYAAVATSLSLACFSRMLKKEVK